MRRRSHRRNLSRGVVVVGSLQALVGCAASHVTPAELAFVVSFADVPEVADDGVAVGMNIDGVVSDGSGRECTDLPDDTSPISGAPGVDNLFARYHLSWLFVRSVFDAPDGVAGASAALIASGDALLVFDVREVDSLVSDEHVTVALLLGATVDGGHPLTGPDGRLAPGQPLAVREELGTNVGAIVEGRLEVTVPLFPLRLRLGGTTRELSVRSAHIAADIGPTELERGEVGGTLHTDEPFIRWIDEDLGGCVLFDACWEPRSDVDYDAATRLCRGVSIGLLFDAVGANVVR